MKIVIAGGTHQAEYIISLFNEKKNHLIVINSSKDEADRIINRYDVPVTIGEGFNSYTLDIANAYDADIFIALSEKDTDNYASCILAKNCFNVKKCICVVSNPKNVDIFHKLGIDSVISSSYVLGQTVKDETSVDLLSRTLSFENDKVAMVEAIVLSKHALAGKKLMEAGFPRYASVSLIIRGEEVIIPNGQVQIRAKDKLLIMCASENQHKILEFIEKGN